MQTTYRRSGSPVPDDLLRFPAVFTLYLRSSTGTDRLSGDPGLTLPPQRVALIIWVVDESHRCLFKIRYQEVRSMGCGMARFLLQI